MRKNSFHISFLLIVLFSAVNILKSADIQKIEELLSILNYQETTEIVLSESIENVHKILGTDKINESKIARLEKRLRDLYDWNALKVDLTEYYTENYTDEEISEIVDLLNTRKGKMVLVIMNGGQSVLSQFVAEKKTHLMREIEMIINASCGVPSEGSAESNPYRLWEEFVQVQVLNDGRLADENGQPLLEKELIQLVEDSIKAGKTDFVIHVSNRALTRDLIKCIDLLKLHGARSVNIATDKQ